MKPSIWHWLKNTPPMQAYSDWFDRVQDRAMRLVRAWRK